MGPEVRISGPGWHDEAIDNSAPIREEQYRQLERAIHRRLRESDQLQEVARVSRIYKKLGIAERFEFIEHAGVRECDGRRLFDFLGKYV